MKKVKLSLDTAKALYQQGGASKLFALDNYTEEEINKKELPKRFTDLGKISGYYIDSRDGQIEETNNCNSENIVSNGVIPTESLAKAVIALCKLLYLRDVYNGNWKADWNDNTSEKYVIIFINDKVGETDYLNYSKVLAFKTSAIRKEFLNNFKDLIEEAKELL